MLPVVEYGRRRRDQAEALVARPSTHSFPSAEFEALYRANLKRRGKWLSQFVPAESVAAE